MTNRTLHLIESARQSWQRSELRESLLDALEWLNRLWAEQETRRGGIAR